MASSEEHSKTVQIRNLPFGISEINLFKILVEAGDILAMNVVRHKQEIGDTTEATVKFVETNCAQTAIKIFDGIVIKGHRIEVKWSQDHILSADHYIGKIIAKNLSKEINEYDLQDWFGKHGPILNCFVVRDVRGISMGYGCVIYKSNNSAKAVVNDLNGTVINGLTVILEQLLFYDETMFETEQNSFTKLCIKNLPPKMDNDEFRTIFEQFGEIQHIAIIQHKTGTSKCYGFINYVNHDSALKAVNVMHNKMYENNCLYVLKSYDQEYFNLYKQELRYNIETDLKLTYLMLENIGIHSTADVLYQEISKFGKIEWVRVTTENDEQKGYVCFPNPEEATSFLCQLMKNTEMRYINIGIVNNLDVQLNTKPEECLPILSMGCYESKKNRFMHVTMTQVVYTPIYDKTQQWQIFQIFGNILFDN